MEHDSEFLIFANVGIEGRTGHDYNNLVGGRAVSLVPQGKLSSSMGECP